MIAQTAFSLSFFAQKTLCAALLDRPVSQITALTVAGEYALVAVKGQPYPYAIALTALQVEHDRQRTARGQDLTVVSIDPDGLAIVTGGAESHAVFEDCCDCQDWAKQREAGRPVPHCKHIAAVDRLLSDRARLEAIAMVDYSQFSDEDAIAAGEQAKADLGF